MRAPDRRRRAFTLIELLVVVVIMAILAAVIVPFVISRAQRARAPELAATDIAQSPPNVASLSAEGGRELEPPRITSSTVAVTLEIVPVIEGTGVRARYLARFRGRFTVEAVDPAAEELALFFPFPPGANEVRGVLLSLLGKDGVAREAKDARYTAGGIRWRGRVAPGEAITALVDYEAVGRDTFRYDIAGKDRTGAVRFDVEVRGGRAVVPPSSLEPTSIERERIVWSFDKLISTRPIVLELPARSSPLGRMILLLRLAAIAVLIFGAGYWYLSEGMRPGQLDSFRWSHFLLLALDYSLYFAITSVLLFWTGPWTAAAIAAVIALPLLALHVARISTRDFAWTRAIPLALYTQATAIAAVFFEERRSLVLLGAGVIAVTLLTLTHGRWISARRAHRERAERESERKKALAAAELASDRLAKALELAETARRAAARALEEQTGAELERSMLGDRLARWSRSAAEAQGLLAKKPALAAMSREELERLGAGAEDLRALAERAANELASAEDALRRAIEQAAKLEAKRVEAPRATFCAACGAGVDPAARYCGSCGVLRPASIGCTGCGTPVRLPSQLLKKRWMEAPLHCEICGTGLTGTRV